jgi:hypothetical protein
MNFWTSVVAAEVICTATSGVFIVLIGPSEVGTGPRGWAACPY